LQFTRRPVEQVAWSVGYEDPTAFRRVFSRFIGLSPGHYRRRFAMGADDASNELEQLPST
jgi:transcriptional regulator GlxA family with amidase domain